MFENVSSNISQGDKCYGHNLSFFSVCARSLCSGVTFDQLCAGAPYCLLSFTFLPAERKDMKSYVRVCKHGYAHASPKVHVAS